MTNGIADFNILLNVALIGATLPSFFLLDCGKRWVKYLLLNKKIVKFTIIMFLNAKPTKVLCSQALIGERKTY